MFGSEDCQRCGDEDAGESDYFVESDGGGYLFAEGDESGDEKEQSCEAWPENEA
jgi:hypothetical protein